MTQRTYADSSTLQYAYEAGTSRLASTTDPKGQTRSYAYFVDDALAHISYSGTVTPNVSLTYDTTFPRLTSMIDGSGTMTYSYYPTGTLGAGQPETITGSGTNNTITYTYDEVGRRAGRIVNSSTESYTYDSKGRTSEITNALGTFGYTFDGSSSRLTGVTYPSGPGLGLSASYSGTTSDNRLEELTSTISGTTVSDFQYEYDPVGNITQWKQKIGAATAQSQWDLSYDAASQLTGGQNSLSGTISQQVAYAYDAVSNRLTQQEDSTITTGSFNNLNQLTVVSNGGKMQFSGTVGEPSTVTIGGVAASVNSSNFFTGFAPVATGSNTIPIIATDASGNSRTNSIAVTVATSGTQSFTYDANGNRTADGERTYEWDAENRLAAINYTGTSKETIFSYDGFGRRTRIVEKDGGTTTADNRYIWDGQQIVEQQDSSGTTLRRYFDQGFIDGSMNYFYLKDHLGSIVGLVDNSGVVRGQWVYDLWGNRSENQITTGAIESDFSYTGHFNHAPSNLVLAPFRTYDPSTAGWLSRDPVNSPSLALELNLSNEENSNGIKDWTLIGELPLEENLYMYGANDPLSRIDPLGLSPNDSFVPDRYKHGGNHVDWYRDGKNMGRYRPDGSGINFKGMCPPKIPNSLMSKFLKAASKLGGETLMEAFWYIDLMNSALGGPYGEGGPNSA